MSKWEEFENDLAKELGLNRVAGSGNQWYSKLDVQGKDTRWSLKFTEQTDKNLIITRQTIAEAILATGGIGGGGEIPIWATRLEGFGDFVTMRLEDWKSFFIGKTGFTITPTKTQERREKARTPRLLQEDTDGN